MASIIPYKTLQEFEEAFNLHSYQDYIDNRTTLSKRIQMILILHGVKNSEELFDKINSDYDSTCPYCNTNKKIFKTFFDGYRGSCTQDECKKKHLSNTVKTSHANMSEETKQLKIEKISNTLMGRKPEILSKETIMENKPFLFDFHDNIIDEEFRNFAKNNTMNWLYINSIAEQFYDFKTREEIYDFVFQNPQYCSCGKKARYENFTLGYHKTCGDKECITQSTAIQREINGVDNKAYEKRYNKHYFTTNYPHLDFEDILEMHNQLTFSEFLMVGKIFHNANSAEEIYNIVYPKEKCEACGDNAVFLGMTKGYQKTCGDKYCIDLVSLKSKQERGSLTQTEETKEKIAKTNLERYGVASYIQSAENKERMRLKREEEIPQIIEKFNEEFKDKLELLEFERVAQNAKFKCLKCNKDFYHYVRGSLYNGKIACPDCFPATRTEARILYYIQELGFNVRKSRDLIPPKEIDMYIEDNKFAIEYNGVMFHSQGYNRGSEMFIDREPSFHLDKTIAVEEQGIQLFHIFENEWVDTTKQAIWKSIIENKLGISKRIYARNCEIKEVSLDDSAEFLEQNHMQGSAKAKYKYGLYFKGELVSLMTFGTPRDTAKTHGAQFELIRFCNKINTTVIGGSSKLLKHFERKHQPDSILSYANRRWSQGKMYENLGFEFIKDTSPNYFYFKFGSLNLQPRQKFQKHKLPELLEVFNESLSEYQNMVINQYRRIFDVGNKLYIKNYK